MTVYVLTGVLMTIIVLIDMLIAVIGLLAVMVLIAVIVLIGMLMVVIGAVTLSYHIDILLQNSIILCALPTKVF